MTKYLSTICTTALAITLSATATLAHTGHVARVVEGHSHLSNIALALVACAIGLMMLQHFFKRNQRD